ncbi:hypothetical protein EVAR_30713_1 [Eumeta japonica]|uniref:Uncharacterized protein n=1 Tax=Eumeta variegata TaxID=151549 RepID=A0A4C1V5T7_EUMVA|nr:hypothetical protein EVAR_30713_1 [Eumeta japonica]
MQAITPFNTRHPICFYPHSLLLFIERERNRKSFIIYCYIIINIICEPQLASEYYVFGINKAQTRSRARNYGGRRVKTSHRKKTSQNLSILIRLPDNPEITAFRLKSFDGEPENWPIFYETFRSIIHENNDLNDDTVIAGIGDVTSSIEGVVLRLTIRSRYDDSVRFTIQPLV